MCTELAPGEACKCRASHLTKPRVTLSVRKLSPPPLGPIAVHPSYHHIIETLQLAPNGEGRVLLTDKVTLGLVRWAGPTLPGFTRGQLSAHAGLCNECVLDSW